MTIDSIGYAGSIAPNTAWADLQQILSHEYVVADLAAAKVAPLVGGTRQVTVATGVLGGQGIRDHITVAETVQLPTVASGTNWFLVVLRRTWGVTQASSIAVINAGTNPATLPARSTTPGVEDDQPLALVPLTAGSNTPGAPIDLRVIGAYSPGSYLAVDDRVLQYMSRLGVHIRIGADTWVRGLNPAGTAALWIWDGPPATVHTSAAGFPAAATAATTATVVVDRIVVPARPGPRAVHMLTNCYCVTTITGTTLNLVLYANGAALGGYARKELLANSPDVLVCSGKYSIPANTAVTFEARVNRFGGTGVWSTSVSAGLTNTNLLAVRA